jgi:hypothetical protein
MVGVFFSDVAHFPSFRMGGKYEPTIASPHPAVDHSVPMAAFVLTFGVELAWFSEVAFPYAAFVVTVATLAGAVLVQRVQRKLRGDPKADLFVLGEPWAALMAVLTAAVVADLIERGAPAGKWIENLAMTFLIGGPVLLVVGGMLGLALSNRAAEGGPIPMRSRARRAVCLAPWRSVASGLALPNFFVVLSAMAHTETPWTSVGSLVALVCFLLVLLVTIAQQHWLRELSRPPPPDPLFENAYRKAPPHLAEEEIPDDLRRSVVRRELVRGIIAIVIAAAVALFHAFVLFG